MFGERLKKLRHERGYSMGELINLYNTRFGSRLNKSTLSRYENDLQEPMFTVVKNLADLFSVSTDYFVSENSDFAAQNIKNSEIGKRIKELRESLGMTQAELAKAIGYTSVSSRSTINKIELGINDIAQSKLPKYAKVLNTTVEYLLGLDHSEQSSNDNNMKGSQNVGIGFRIKEAREKLGLTQTELGKLVGVTGSAITNYEKNLSHPKEPILYKLIEALDIDANYLFQDVIPLKKGERIRYLREKNGMTQSELAERLHTIKQTVHKYEVGVITNIPIDKIEKIAEVFDVSPAYIMGWEDEANQQNEQIGLRIKQARLDKGLSLADVAEKVGVNKSTIMRYEKGAIEKIKLPIIEAIARVLEVDAAWIVGKNNSVAAASDFTLSDNEKRLVAGYRNHPELQAGINRMLDIPAPFLRKEGTK